MGHSSIQMLFCLQSPTSIGYCDNGSACPVCVTFLEESHYRFVWHQVPQDRRDWYSLLELFLLRA